jgi:hypothetical protein
MVEKALSESKSRNYLDVVIGNRVIVAAEIVAAAGGQPSPDLPDEVAEWILEQRLVVDAKLKRMALISLKEIFRARHSELEDSWKETQYYTIWKQTMDDLIRRIESLKEKEGGKKG